MRQTDLDEEGGPSPLESDDEDSLNARFQQQLNCEAIPSHVAKYRSYFNNHNRVNDATKISLNFQIKSDEISNELICSPEAISSSTSSNAFSKMLVK